MSIEERGDRKEGPGEALIRELGTPDRETATAAVRHRGRVESDTMIVVRLAGPIDQGRISPLRWLVRGSRRVVSRQIDEAEV